jgi:tetratricopeptide (TPR) repeat protein
VAAVLEQEPMELIPLVSGELEKQHRLIQLDGVQRVGDHRLSVFRFRHSLFQQFLYQRLDGAEKAYYHEKLGRALEGLYGDRSEQKALPLARHFREAGLLEEAIGYLRLAGERAKRAAAYDEGLSLFREARALLQGLPDSPSKDRLELEVLTSLSLVAWVLGLAVRDPEGVLARVKALAEELGDDQRLFWALGCTFGQHHFLGEPDRGRQVLQELARVVERSGDSGQLVQLNGWQAFNAVHRGFPEEALPYLDQAEKRYDPVLHQHLMGFWNRMPLPFFRSFRALALAPLGRLEEAERCIEDASDFLGRQPDPASLFYVRLHDLLFRILCGDVEGVARCTAEFQSFTDQIGPGGWSAVARFASGWCLAAGYQVQEGTEAMREAMTDFERYDWGAWQPYFKALLADGLRKIGKADESLVMVRGALERIEDTGERCQESEVNRILGEILLSLPIPDSVGAESAFRRSISIARGQGARLYELRSLVGLGRLLQGRGRSQEARRELEECFLLFDQGFELPDLVGAKRLLEELA